MIHLSAQQPDFTPKQFCKKGLKKSERMMGTANSKENVLSSFLAAAKTASNREKRNAEYTLKRSKHETL